MANELSARTSCLRQRAIDSYSPRRAAERAEIYDRVYAETDGQPQVLRAARCLAAFLRQREIVISPEDLLAGHTQFYDYAYPAALGGWEAFLRERDVPPEPGSNLFGPPPYPPVGPRTTRYAYERAVGSAYEARPAAEAEVLEQFCRGVRIGLFFSWPGGHAIAGYDRLLEHGLGAYAAAAREHLAEAEGPARDFAEASLITCEAASDLSLRYAGAAAAAGDREGHARLARIAEACRWVAHNPPRTFFEAIQLLWLAHEVITCEQESGSMSLGRLDEYLSPFYARDLAEGTLTCAEAAELVEALWLKFAHLRRGFQNVTLGGPRGAGSGQADELAVLCLRASRNLRMDQPLLSLRWTPAISPALWDEAEALIREGTGFPALFNDAVAVAAKKRIGIAPGDAANYGIVGCVELSVPGKEFAHTEGLRVNWAKVLELVLHEGVCQITGETLALSAPHELGDVTSFEEFCGWYRAELEHFTRLGMRALNVIDGEWPSRLPYPFLSSLMVGCLDSGSDVTAGGTCYNLSSVNGMGMADVVDSLMAIKRRVFEARRATLADLAMAASGGLQSGPSTGRLGREPLYGNDEAEPDKLMAELTQAFCDCIEGNANPRGGRFQVGLYSVDNHARKGKLTGALPSGRSAGVALANALSPCQGADMAGPTALMLSATRVDHSRLGNGMVLDLKFHPAFFADEGLRRAFYGLVKTYFQLGGLEVQFNVISRDTLLCAQRTPQEYRNLLVRVSGFSAYFVDLDRVCQDEIISRTELAAI